MTWIEGRIAQMINSKLSLTNKTNSAKINGEHFWETRFLPKWLPLLLGLGLGMLLAFLITSQAWVVVSLLVLAAPAVMLFSTYPFAGILVWILVTPLLTMREDIGGIYVFWLLHRAMVPLALIAILFPYLFKIKKEWPIRLGRAELAMAAFLGGAILSAILLSRKTLGALYKEYDRFFVAYCLYLLMRLTVPREKEFKLLVWVVVIQTIIQAVVGLLASFAPEVLPPLWYAERAKVRTIGTFNNTARYTSVLVFCILVIYQAAMRWKRRGTRWLLLFTFSLGSLMVFLSYSKGGWLGGVLALIGVLILYPGPTLRIAVILAIVMAVFGGSLLADQLNYAVERLETDSANERMVANVAMWRMIQARPFFGWGYDSLYPQIAKFVVRLDNFAAHANASHNTSLAMMAELGVVGFLLHIFPFVWWLTLTIRAWPRMPKEGFVSRSLVAMLWLSIMFHFVVGNFSDFRTGLSGVFATCLWWATLGLIASLVYPYVNSDDARTLRQVHQTAS